MAVTDEATPGRVLGFAGFRRSVFDLQRAVDFYCGGLGFTCVDDGLAPSRRSACVTLGAQTIELVADAQSDDLHRQARGRIDTAFQHVAIVAADIVAATARLARFAPVSLSTSGPVTLPPGAGGVTAFKVLDPDGHPLELIQFPDGIGDPRWQHAAPGAVTLGIDHSAIVVADAARSMAFYRDGFGFSVAARQVNRGPAQGLLDGLDESVVDVVALRPANSPTPHLELLGYLTPAPHAATSPRADCLLWWADDPGAIGARVTRLTGQVVAQSANGDVELRDPDGHRHRLLRESGLPASSFGL